MSTALFYIFTTFMVGLVACGLDQNKYTSKHPPEGDMVLVYANCVPVRAIVEQNDLSRGWVAVWPLCTFDWNRFYNRRDMEKWMRKSGAETSYVVDLSSPTARILEPAFIDKDHIEYFEYEAVKKDTEWQP